MPTEDDVREIRGHVMNLVALTGRMDSKLDTLEETIREHVRPCKDLAALREKVEGFVPQVQERLATLQNKGKPKIEEGGAKNDRGLLRLVLEKVVLPLVAAVATLAGYIAAKGN